MLLTLLVAVPFIHRVLQESYHFISRVLIEERGPFNTSSPDSTVLFESRILWSTSSDSEKACVNASLSSNTSWKHEMK